MIKEKLKLCGYACLRFLWKQRHPIARVSRAASNGMLRIYRGLPLPAATRNTIKDILFTLLRTMYGSPAYQNWHSQNIGLRRIDALLNPSAVSTDTFVAPAAPADASWQALASHPAAMAEPTVNIIIPVYKGYDETLLCIYNVIASLPANTTPCEIIVINDASPDDALSQKLRELAGLEFFTLVEQKKNQGFVITVNRGMRMHASRDVLLLNADTCVYGNWIDRLRQAAYAQEQTATVTPFSNNAEICSYPYTAQNNTLPLEVDDAVLDTLAGQANRSQTCQLPTAVGFCMYIKRTALDDIGYFDAAMFKEGYGEENDFCLRAFARGWNHVLAGDVYVRHWGNTSFGARKIKRLNHAMRVLAKKYPSYHTTVQQFLLTDPPLAMRRNIDLARLALFRKSRSILFISHHMSGGTERHIQDMRVALEKEDISVYILRPHSFRPGIMELIHSLCPHTPNLAYDINIETPALVSALQALNVRHIHIHHLIGFTINVMDFIPLLSRQLGVAYDFTVHDYFSICPRVNLIDGERVYCGEPDVTVCEVCVRRNGGYNNDVAVWNWRRKYDELLDHARQIYAPSEDVKTRLARYFPSLSIQVRPHAERTPDTRMTPPVHSRDEVLRVALPGAIGVHKGSDILQACVKDAEKRHLPIEFHVIGSTDFGPVTSPHLHVTGKYEEEEIYDLLAKQACHIAFFPSVWPETYCYTLSIAFNAGLLPVAFDLGAQAERIREVGFGKLLPLSMAKDAAAINDMLLSLDVTAPPKNITYATYESMVSDYYGNF